MASNWLATGRARLRSSAPFLRFRYSERKPLWQAARPAFRIPVAVLRKALPSSSSGKPTALSRSFAQSALESMACLPDASGTARFRPNAKVTRLGGSTPTFARERGLTARSFTSEAAPACHCHSRGSAHGLAVCPHSSQVFSDDASSASARTADGRDRRDNVLVRKSTRSYCTAPAFSWRSPMRRPGHHSEASGRARNIAIAYS